MGVTIHYKGQLKSPDLIPDLVAEVADICETRNWKYHFIDETEKDPIKMVLRGVHFKPHEDSESVFFAFDTEGYLCNFLSLILGMKRESKMPWVFTKTQFAGAETHIQIIHLLTYLKKKYFKKMTISDEGGYYPDNNTETLQNRISFLNNAMNTISDIFEHSQLEGKSPDQIVDHLQDALTRSFKDLNIQIMRIEAKDLPNDIRRQIEESNEE
jgi:hypothetical protein